MGSCEFTPNDVLRRLPITILASKPAPDFNSIAKTLEVLPLARSANVGSDGEEGFNRSRVLGTGDWAGEISDGRSATISCGSFVAKFPVGNLLRDPFLLAKERLNTARMFADVSPATFVIVAADGEGNAKPVTIQRRIDGKPVCESPLSSLLNRNTLLGMKEILRKSCEVWEETGLIDFIGQRFQSIKAAELIGLHPFFSDNLMVDRDGEVSLVDNTPDSQVHKHIRKHRKIGPLRNFRLRMIVKSLDLLVNLVTLGERFGLKRERPSTSRMATVLTSK